VDIETIEALAMAINKFEGGVVLVRRVKYWSNTGQILVKYWSNTGQVRGRRRPGAEGGCMVKYWSETGQKRVWFECGDQTSG
jgi:hypothetical protein